MIEEWKNISGYEGLYQISNLGRVKSLQKYRQNKNQTGFTGTYTLLKEKILKPKEDRKGYLCIGLSKNGKSKTFKIHRLVAQEFIVNEYNKPQVNHKNGNKKDNTVNNLEYCTNLENQKHAWENKLQKPRFGIKNPKSKMVIQYDLKGNYIREWNSMMDIERELNIWHTDISSCCRNKIKKAGGYIWKYKNNKS